MALFLIRRILLGFLSLFFITIVTFFIIQAPPGDYVDQWLQNIFFREGGSRGLSIEDAEVIAAAMRHHWGLDRTVHMQYIYWLGRALKGDFGLALTIGRPVSDVIAERMLMTVILALATVLFTWTMAIPIGIYSAVRQRSMEDYTFTFLGFVGLAVPDFMLALLMMYFAFVWWDFDVGGLFSREYQKAPWGPGKIWDLLQHLWIPVIILGTSGTAGLIRILRANLLDELRKPYVTTARAKGLPELKLILKYPVRVALNPLISTVGYILPFLISGSVIVSVVLSLPTVGPLLLQGLLNQDMLLAGTIIMMLGLMTIIGTLLSDILLVLIDPRIRLEQE